MHDSTFTPDAATALGANALYALRLGLAVLRSAKHKPDVLWVNTGDELQHWADPSSRDALDFYAAVDELVGEYDSTGAIVGLTSDHGMNYKVNYEMEPRVVHLGDALDAAGHGPVHVSLPIQGSPAAHAHANLGGAAFVRLLPLATEADDGNAREDEQQALKQQERVDACLACVREQPGVHMAFTSTYASKALALPASRRLVGDIVVIGDQDSVLAASQPAHPYAVGDASELDERGFPRMFRSHGSVSENMVPLFLNRPVADEARRRVFTGQCMNYDLLFVLGSRPHRVSSLSLRKCLR